jgi:hypothetical protein
MRPSRKTGRRTSEEVNLLEFVRSYVKSARLWWRRGESPPPTHYWSLVLALILVAGGLFVVLRLFSSESKPTFKEQRLRAIGLLAFGLLLLTPGLYCLFLSLCCWRRVGGYDWWMIPHFG